uniref:AB hydrolase-1 domain-containing protein n=1 Tax=Oryza punctata TaxID=4537 RepID=A0A0E0L4L9_ORYPU
MIRALRVTSSPRTPTPTLPTCRRAPPPPPPPPAPAPPAAGRRVLGCHLRCRATLAAAAAAAAPMGQLQQQQQLRRDLYPHTEPYDFGFLKVSGVHTIYYEQSGNPQGHPVVFLHGGPGAGTSPGNRRFFDPEFFRIVLFDQVFGGSWGSTLALAYSESHPDKVTGIVLRGIFLVRKKELDWFYEGGAAAIFPDAWEPFRDFIPEDERNCFIAAYSKRLTSSDADVQAFARIENHYFVNKGFLPSDSHLLDNVDKIRHIKAFIVQGRYDVCCPMMSAWDLHKAWPEAEFKMVPDAGHSANEVGVAAELVSANEKLKSMLTK